ncbi:uncharacterized protein LOC119068819 [Bradysia coprophila]|uniref:uncharacterized protein LOC119068819 n=1 Tax=Bradysia coprophila TaxID=38358 RepID=UPI00187DBFA7|nr:uncharacterized protein LOC119068819 [Bradysia coprophila]
MANYLQLVLFYSVIHFAVSQMANSSTDSTPINKCLFSSDVVKCIQNNIFVAMDSAIQDNKTWYLNDYVAIEPNPPKEFQSRSDHDSTFMGKLEDLVQSKHIQFSLNPLEEAGRAGRRRKNKHGGGMFLMSGLAVAAVVIQMVLGKIAFVAAAALILAKIALFVSTTKSQHATTNSSNDHVIYTEPVDHYSEHHSSGPSSGWQRSILPLRDNVYDDTELQIEDYRGGKRRFR